MNSRVRIIIRWPNLLTIRRIFISVSPEEGRKEEREKYRKGEKDMKRKEGEVKQCTLAQVQLPSHPNIVPHPLAYIN
jgi:hypothetical protein